MSPCKGWGCSSGLVWEEAQQNRMRLAGSEFLAFLSRDSVRSFLEMLQSRFGVLVAGIQLQRRPVLLGGLAPLPLRFIEAPQPTTSGGMGRPVAPIRSARQIGLQIFLGFGQVRIGEHQRHTTCIRQTRIVWTYLRCRFNRRLHVRRFILVL